MTRGWLRRNLVPLGAIVLLLPACAFVLPGLPALEVADSVTPPTPVDAGETVNAYGFDYTLTSSTELEGEGVDANQIPLGTSLVVVTFAVEPDAAELEDSLSDDPAPAELCEMTLTDRTDAAAGERTWQPLIDTSPYGYETEFGSRSFCNPGSAEPQQLELVFLTPTGVFDSGTVDVDITSTTAETLLRFALD